MTLFVPAAVLFDLDGVLIESLSHHFHSWRTILSEYNIDVTLRDIALGEGERADVSLRRFFREKANCDISEEEVTTLLQNKRTIFRENNPPKLLPEAKSVLQFFRDKKVPIGLVSGSAITNVRNSLTDEDLGLFNTTVTGEANLPGKPDPAPYREAIKRLHVEPEKCWVVENAPFGVRSAKAAGAFTIALTTTLSKEDLTGADVFCERITEVIDLFNQVTN